MALNVTQESVAGPSADEHDCVDWYPCEVHFHRGTRAKRMCTYLLGLKAKTGAANGCASCPKRCDHLVRSDLFPPVMAPNRADWSILCCARICPNPFNESSPLLHRAQDLVVCPTVDDRLMFVVIFLHFERHCHAVC